MDLAINNVKILFNCGEDDCVCVCVCVCVSVSLLRTFMTLSTLQNPFDKHITYFNQNGWFQESGMGN